MVETLISISNFGLSKDIPHDHSYLEKAMISEGANEAPVGIKDIEESSNMINRMMAFIHKV